MDFGVVGLNNLVSSNSTSNNGSSSIASETAADINNHKLYGSGFLKQERTVNEDDLRSFKLSKTSSVETTLKVPLQRCNNSTSLSETHQQMLSFSSPNSQMLSFSHNQTMGLPFYYQTSSAISRNTGYGSGGLNAASMHGVLSGARGPFTPSQWLELEHQALIYKYITANVPIPPYLLNPIRKALESSAFSSFSSLRHNALGWGAFHLGFSNTDPEPGRCRRTDGKKWRCSRDAVADQKYCERHMNRGRHRSRKPVEGQTGHSASATTTTNGKSTPIASSMSSSSVVAAGGASKNLNLLHHHQLNNHLSEIPSVNRSLIDKENVDVGYQHVTVLSMTSPRMSLKDNQQQHNAYEESSRPEFGSVYSDSLVNPLNYDHENKSQHGLRQFMDAWPKNESAISWNDDKTQLSISIPIVTSSSPTKEKLASSPIRLSRELEETQMGLSVGTISWESSMGGPLGEVLHTTSNSTIECKKDKALNLIENWDHSPRLASSPSGVFRGAFGSLSNSSGGSSPRADGAASFCNGLIGPGLMLPSLPAL